MAPFRPLSEETDAARVDHDPVYLTRRGQQVAAGTDADDLDRPIAAAEDLADQPRPSGAQNLVGGDGEWRAPRRRPGG